MRSKLAILVLMMSPFCSWGAQTNSMSANGSSNNVNVANCGCEICKRNNIVLAQICAEKGQASPMRGAAPTSNYNPGTNIVSPKGNN